MVPNKNNIFFMFDFDFLFKINSNMISIYINSTLVIGEDQIEFRGFKQTHFINCFDQPLKLIK